MLGDAPVGSSPFSISNFESPKTSLATLVNHYARYFAKRGRFRPDWEIPRLRVETGGHPGLLFPLSCRVLHNGCPVYVQRMVQQRKQSRQAKRLAARDAAASSAKSREEESSTTSAAGAPLGQIGGVPPPPTPSPGSLAGVKAKDQTGAFWNHPWTGRAFVVAALTAILFFFLHTPAPGIAIGVLGAVAVIVSMRELSANGKIFWVCVIFLLLWFEIKAIRTDRAETNKQQLSQRDEQNKAFEKVLAEQNADFQATARTLEQVMETGHATLQNTTPHAVIDITGILPSQPALVAGAKIGINVYFRNVGNEDTNEVNYSAGIYIEPPNDLKAEGIITKSFEELWKAHHGLITNGDVIPHAPPFWNTFSTPELSQDDVDALHNGTKVVYVIARARYQDHSETWVTTECHWLQDVMNPNVVLHPCELRGPTHQKLKG
jgi:hypothetical protein